MRVLILDILDDDLAANLLGSADDIRQGQLNALDHGLPVSGIEIEIVVVPRRVRRMDNHLGCANIFGGFQRLQQTGRDGFSDKRIVTVDLEPPKRSMNSKPPFETIEKLLDPVGDTSPVALQRLRTEEILQLQIALPRHQPLAIGRQRVDRQRRSKNWLRAGGHHKLQAGDMSATLQRLRRDDHVNVGRYRQRILWRIADVLVHKVLVAKEGTMAALVASFPSW